MSVIRCEIPSNSVEWSDPNGKPGRKDFEMKNYIMLDGRKFEIDEKNSMLLRAVVGEEKEEKKNPFIREDGQIYYYISGFGSVAFSSECGMNTDDNRYEVGNYSTDEKLMEQRALHETLDRLLWRFSEANGGEGEKFRWYIWRDADDFHVDYNVIKKNQGTVYFSSGEIAKRALEEIVRPFMVEHPEFVW
mgnify:CR=1 FL=1